jgi:hypothetical protein
VIEEALRARLIGQSGLTALVSTRVYPLGLPQNPTLPAITYALVSDNGHTTSEATAGNARPGSKSPAGQAHTMLPGTWPLRL